MNDSLWFDWIWSRLAPIVTLIAGFLLGLIPIRMQLRRYYLEKRLRIYAEGYSRFRELWDQLLPGSDNLLSLDKALDSIRWYRECALPYSGERAILMLGQCIRTFRMAAEQNQSREEVKFVNQRAFLETVRLLSKGIYMISRQLGLSPEKPQPPFLPEIKKQKK